MEPHPPLDRFYAPTDKREFVTGLFDRGARHYEWINGLMALGSGVHYRRRALRAAGLRPGMRHLDVAIGTGLVARASLSILREPRAVVGIDLSAGMLQEARARLPVTLVRGLAERLPFADQTFDFVTMGYALRHVPDLETTFREYLRVLRPGGRVLVLEITRPRTAPGYVLARTWLGHLVPWLSRLTTRSRDADRMMQYYWETIEACVPPDAILSAMRAAGLVGVRRTATFGMFSEYHGLRAGPAPGP